MSPKAPHQTTCCRLLMFVASLMLLQTVTPSSIKIRPNTFKEFQFIKCQGEFDKEQYSFLVQICDDCYNLFRNPNVLLDCKANCFQNPVFPACINRLLLKDKETEIKGKLYYVSGADPPSYPETHDAPAMVLL
ncbi:hypothetical protein SK128_012079 [Halocaridina rubra]|uniref:Uncharacterized protein n=1 Tax=Halocaridina rubra TaxID=373956 RepID=A0AAN8ZTY6_HALRR